MSVSVVIPTRGDVDLKPILRAYPEEWEVIVYDNGAGGVFKRVAETLLARIVTGKGELPDLSVYARYAAIEYATHELILTQDDDCVVSEPQAIVDAFLLTRGPFAERICQHGLAITPGCPSCDAGHARSVVCNMPPEFRHDFYTEHALVGFGACFHRDAPARAFERWYATSPPGTEGKNGEWGLFKRTCDIVFTALTPRVLVDVPKTNLPWADDETRMYRQPTHQAERAAMLELVCEIGKETA